MEKLSLKYLSNDMLTERVKILAQKEKEILHKVIEYLREFDSRKLYLKLGYPSLFEYMTQELKYSAGSAQRRIDAARLSREVPEVLEKIKTGELQLNQISTLQRMSRQANKENKKEVVKEIKKSLITKIENKTQLETEAIISNEFNIAPKSQEKLTAQSNESVRLEITFTKEQFEKLKKCRELLSHKCSSANWAELLETLCDESIKKNDPARPTRKKNEIHCHLEVKNLETQENHLEVCSTKTKPPYPKAIPRPVRRYVFQTQSGCQYVSPLTGKKCNSRHLLQIDHIQPRWAGGANDSKNLRLLCAAHNQGRYRQQVGLIG